MARFTIDECLEHIKNRYDMTLAAAILSQKLHNGRPTLIKDSENDKFAVLALREIASGNYPENTLLHQIEAN